MLKSEPWVEDNDSFIEYYGLLTDDEIEDVKKLFIHGVMKSLF